MLALVSNFGGTGLAIRLSDVFVRKLVLHVDLSATPFRTRFQDVDTSTFGGCYKVQKYQYMHTKKKQADRLTTYVKRALEGFRYFWIELDY